MGKEVSGFPDYRLRGASGLSRDPLLLSGGMNRFQLDDPVNILTHRIIGCAMQVHRSLGNGFQEVIYQRALAIEFEMQGIDFLREKEMEIFYRGKMIGTRRADFLVEKEIMVELKAIHEILDVHKAQTINYCEAYGCAHGLLINFGGRSLEFKRVYNKDKQN
jgi:GxxExxY protein